MTYRRTIDWEDLGVRAEIASFAPEGKVEEIHAILHVAPRGELFEGQLGRLLQAEGLLLQDDGVRGAAPLMKRYFLSDAANQQPLMPSDGTCAVSLIQQPCLDGSKIAVWTYLQKGTEVTAEHGATVASHNGYRHIFRMNLTRPEGGSYEQTEAILREYEETLARFGANLTEHCIRTWFFVRDVDVQYTGMVQARRKRFAELGMTEATHYLSSTGIGGAPADPRAFVQLGAWAVTGLAPGQQRYLHAPTHLNPTHEYGVTFERGTAVDYGDRRHVIISGTASIDNRGEVVHTGAVVSQTRRMWENVQALLEEAGSGFGDVMQIVVYLRDTADYPTVRGMFRERFPDIPTVFTWAPVCRPKWLIEMECVAVTPQGNGAYRDL